MDVKIQATQRFELQVNTVRTETDKQLQIFLFWELRVAAKYFRKQVLSVTELYMHKSIRTNGVSNKFIPVTYVLRLTGSVVA